MRVLLSTYDSRGGVEPLLRPLFPRAAAVVHNGGVGTTTTAARACAPQAVVPQGVDQRYWAGRVVDLGIGTAYDAGRRPSNPCRQPSA